MEDVKSKKIIEYLFKFVSDIVLLLSIFAFVGVIIFIMLSCVEPKFLGKIIDRLKNGDIKVMLVVLVVMCLSCIGAKIFKNV